MDRWIFVSTISDVTIKFQEKKKNNAQNFEITSEFSTDRLPLNFIMRSIRNMGKY
jgi:hypothetical protein